MKGSILLVEDDRSMCELLRDGLTRRGYTVAYEHRADTAFPKVLQGTWDVVLTDLNMPGMSGLELCERITANRPELPVVVLTAFGSLEAAIEAIRVGAYDFVQKPVELDSLTLVLDRAVRHRALQQEVRRLREAAKGAEPERLLLGESAPMRRVHELIDRIADRDASVLINGESGTGKELVARALHEGGRRRSGPFVAVNCAAMPEQLLESELFGHVKGAFTDARNARAGLFVQANGGTVFLDEIGELPLPLQPKLLRALQERKVRPLGGEQEVAFDARVITATNRDLEEEVAAGRFREDLFFRIHVVTIDLPPLRTRGNDILLLAQRFIEQQSQQMNRKVAGMSSEVARRLLDYAWPGNVRELQNCIERAIALTATEELTVEDLPERVRSYRRRASTSTQLPDVSEIIPLEELERRYILQVLEHLGGQRSQAAQLLGMDRKTLYRKLERWSAQPDSGRGEASRDGAKDRGDPPR